MCLPDCGNLPRMLSSDPDDYPIKSGIAPLVFELRRTGFYVPCWSCEGHLGREGKLWKRPQVWFYCRCEVHLRLLADLLCSLDFARRLNAHWAVVVTHSDTDNPETTYALRPLAEDSGDTGAGALAALQADAQTIARALPDLLAAEAESLKEGIA
jgi:hypothetical protein